MRQKVEHDTQRTGRRQAVAGLQQAAREFTRAPWQFAARADINSPVTPCRRVSAGVAQPRRNSRHTHQQRLLERAVQRVLLLPGTG